MAVLKSPKNNKRKFLWMQTTSKKPKKTSFYFYKDENFYQRSSLESHASRSDYVLLPSKYRQVKSDVKTEIRIYGKILPPTMEPPVLPRNYSTVGSSSWSKNSDLNSREFWFFLNSVNYHK